MTDQEKTRFLLRLFDGDAHVGGELRAFVRQRLTSGRSAPTVAARSVGELRAAAAAIRQTRERLDAVVRRGDGVWCEIETEIGRSNTGSYDRAAALLMDLHSLAEEKGTREEFLRRLRAIRERHARKQRFIERLTTLG